MRLMILITVLLIGLGLAQGGDQDGRFQNLPEDLRKKLQAYQPVFDLSRTVNILGEVDKQKGLAFTKAQAQKLLPILKDLQTRSDLKPADAQKILSNLEDNILSDAQLNWIDQTQLQRQQQARQRFQQGGGQGQGEQGSEGGQGQGPHPGGPGDRGGFFQAIQAGKPFNPFKDNPRAKDNLVTLVALLQKK